MSKPRLSRAASMVLCAGFLLTGCAVGPDYERPLFELPLGWLKTKAAPAEGLAADRAGERWWALYADPTLDRLIDEALEHNNNYATAAARVLEVRAQARITDSNLYPSVSGSLSGNRTQSSERGTFPLGNIPRIQNDYRATLDVSYEIDFWGKYRRASEAARADLFAAESAREALRLSLTAQVAQQYFALIAADAQVVIAERTLASRDETLRLFTRRFEAGTLAAFDLHQAEAEQAATRSQLAALRRLQDGAESSLALLLGRSPRAVMGERVERALPSALPADADLVIPAGLPSDLLLRRPDLREAEARLIAANARIGVARAAYFPSIGLTAYFGSESTDFSDLFTGPAGIFQFAAGLTQPIWNAGRITAGVEASEAQRTQVLAQYRQAVASAFKDVRDAMAAQKAARESLSADEARVAALGKALKQAEQRFDAGIASRLEVLDVERNLLAAQLAEADNERARKAALADLFKALGGGWEKSEAAEAAKAAAAAPASPR